MLADKIEVDLRLPEEISLAARQKAERLAREAVILVLVEEGELTLRRGADELGLSYHEMLDLMEARGIPAVRGPLDLDALEQTRRKLVGEDS
jgi:hypothetical protein